MNLRYFLEGAHWFDIVSIWCLVLPVSALLLTGNIRKSYGISLALSLTSLQILALTDSELLTTKSFDELLHNSSLVLHSVAATFFMVHFTDPTRRKDQRLVLYMLSVGFIILFLLIGAWDVAYFIVNMACSVVLFIFGVSAIRHLLEDFGSGNHAVGGRLVMVISLMVARLGLLGLYAYVFLAAPETQAFAQGFESVTLLSSISLTIGLIQDAGYDPDKMEEDDGPYEALKSDPN